MVDQNFLDAIRKSFFMASPGSCHHYALADIIQMDGRSHTALSNDLTRFETDNVIQHEDVKKNTPAQGLCPQDHKEDVVRVLRRSKETSSTGPDNISCCALR